MNELLDYSLACARVWERAFGLVGLPEGVRAALIDRDRHGSPNRVDSAPVHSRRADLAQSAPWWLCPRARAHRCETP